MPTWPCQPPYPRTPNEYTLETKYKDNTKSSEIQIYFRFFAKMVHFAFSACNALNINAEKSSFFQWFLCIFPKTAVLTKITFQFHKIPATQSPQENSQNMDNTQNLLCAICAQGLETPLIAVN